ncbi:MAG: hypothetical protein GF331_04105 [Chitinivibrionales bacterium]|nr:hypothetical protein [Chitinivibrionales bacterium]
MKPATTAIIIAIVLACGVVHARRQILFGDADLADSVLTLERCFVIAREHNAELRRAVAGVVETYGEKIRSRGRFLPRLDILYGWGKYKLTDSIGHIVDPRDESLTLEVRQRVIEFGRTTDAELDRRDRERQALYNRENTIVDVLSSIRRTYRSLQIIDRQLASHDSLLTHYAQRQARAQDRLDKGIGLRTALLTARLNRLEERERILRLRTNRREQIAELKELLGLSTLPLEVRLAPVEQDELPEEDSCVVLALENSTELADKKAELLQAGQVLGQTGWDFLLDDISFTAGMYKGDRGAELELITGGAEGSTRQWAIDAVGKRYIDAPNGSSFVPRDTTLRYTAAIELAIPAFRGAQRHATVIEKGAAYTKARADLIAKTREIERETRDAYYGYLLSSKYLAIAEERIAIARERYDMAETQHELGRMSDDGLDDFRVRLFESQDAFFEQQFEVLRTEEELRAHVRALEH